MAGESKRPTPGGGEPAAAPLAPGLYLVATPIGNAADITLRALDILARADALAAEDTRQTRKLMDIHGVPLGNRPLVSYHDRNGPARRPQIMGWLAEGRSVAYCSDAGTPLVSDPGYRFVSAAHEAGFRVSPVPGPCAAIAGLSAAGLPSDRFWFEGFLPAKQAGRRHRLQALADTPSTLIFYVPARDLTIVLEDLCQIMGGGRLAAVGRELTKLHETVRRGSLTMLAEFCHEDKNQARGEAVLLVSGSADPALSPVDPGALARELARELAPSRAAAVLSRLTSLSRKQAWALIEKIREAEPSPQRG